MNPRAYTVASENARDSNSKPQMVAVPNIVLLPDKRQRRQPKLAEGKDASNISLQIESRRTMAGSGKRRHWEARKDFKYCRPFSFEHLDINGVRI
jgi:hypothetical protein